MDATPIQFACTEDGVNIAYRLMGSAPPPAGLTVSGHLECHAETIWEFDAYREFLTGIGQERRRRTEARA